MNVKDKDFGADNPLKRRLEHLVSEGTSSSTTEAPSGAFEDSSRPSANREISTPTRNNYPDRRRSRVPHDVDPDSLLEAFTTGDPSIVYEKAKEIVTRFKLLESEVARLRFKNNFGTSVCNSCEGLKASVYIEATCFQTGKCFYQPHYKAEKK